MNWKSEWRRRKCQIDKQCTLYSNCKRCSFAIPLGEIEKTRYQIFTNRSPLTPLCWCNIWFGNFLLDILFPFNHSWDSLANRLIYLVDYSAIVLVCSTQCKKCAQSDPKDVWREFHNDKMNARFSHTRCH